MNDGIANYAKAFTVTVSDVNEAPDDIKFGKNIFKDGLLLHFCLLYTSDAADE